MGKDRRRRRPRHRIKRSSEEKSRLKTREYYYSNFTVFDLRQERGEGERERENVRY